MGYCFLSTGKIKTKEQFEQSMAHNYRRDEVLNADPSKKELNKELIALESENYLDAYYQIVNKSPIYMHEKVRHDAVKAIEVMLTYTGKIDSDKFSQEAWEQKNVEWLREKFGSEYVVSAMCHYDETTPHIHAIVIPMVNGRLNAKHYLGGSGACKALQTEYANAMKGFGLERGLEGTGAKHTDIKKFYSVVEKALQHELPDVQKDETAEEYRERANAEHKDSHLKYLHVIEEEKRKKEVAKASYSKVKKELDAATKELEFLRGEYEKRKRAESVIQKKSERMDELLSGLRNGCLPEDERAMFENMMDRLYQDERKRSMLENISVEKKAFLMDELLAAIKHGSAPLEERKEFEIAMKEIVNWERSQRQMHEAERTEGNPTDAGER